MGQGRVYVQLGQVDKVDFSAWCEGVARGRSYISDGYAHALEFTVEGKAPGDAVELKDPGEVKVQARVAFASATPLGMSVGGAAPAGKTRKVELVVNGAAGASQDVPADDGEHDLTFTAKIEKSSWVALRSFPQMHTNPANVLVGGKPIRASRKSALWCVGVIEQLWAMRERAIAEPEREEAKKTFDRAIEAYRRTAKEADERS